MLPASRRPRGERVLESGSGLCQARVLAIAEPHGPEASAEPGYAREYDRGQPAVRYPALGDQEVGGGWQAGHGERAACET